MKNVILAASAVAALSTAALADYTVTFSGPESFTASGGFTVTTPAMTGTITGIIFHFNYVGSGDSWAADIAATLDSLQWGGYDEQINGTTAFVAATGAPNSAAATSFTSGTLNLPAAMNLAGQSVVVGYGNGYSTGVCTLDSVTVTLVGTVPTPGAAAALSLGGLAAFRRRRA